MNISMMGSYLVILYVLFILTNGQENGPAEETMAELCSNETEGSCEIFNTTEPITTTIAEETNTPETTMKQKTTTVKPIIKKPIVPAPNNTVTTKPDPGCTCDNTRGGCEMNCCCDVDCDTEQRVVFTHCIPQPYSENPYECFSPPSNQSVLGVMCVVRQNTILTTDHIDVPVLQTVSNFEKKLRGKKYYAWPNPPPPLKPIFEADVPYNIGSPIWITDNSTILNLEFPVSVGHSSECYSKLVPKYLEDMVTSCSKRIRNKSECLNSKIFNFNVISSPYNFNFTQVQGCTEDVCLPVHQFVCINRTCTETLIPQQTFNESSNVCQNYIESTEYKIYHNGTQGIVEVKVYYTLKNISVNSDQLHHKKNSVSFLLASRSDQSVLKRSGKPGYEISKPLISGKKTLKSVTFNYSSTDWISVGTAGNSGYCQNRQNVLFGENIKTWCLLKVNGNCKQIQTQIWQQLLGSAVNLSETVVSSYGDPYTERQTWVPILSAPIPSPPAIITAVNIVIVHSLVGSTSLPQAKIIGVYLNVMPSTVDCEMTSVTHVLPIETSVRFIDKTTPAVTKFAQPPVYEIKLPKDFFYPFFSRSNRITLANKCFIVLFLLCLM